MLLGTEAARVLSCIACCDVVNVTVELHRVLRCIACCIASRCITLHRGASRCIEVHCVALRVAASSYCAPGVRSPRAERGRAAPAPSRPSERHAVLRTALDSTRIRKNNARG